MKKIFTLFAISMMALSANAQDVWGTWASMEIQKDGDDTVYPEIMQAYFINDPDPVTVGSLTVDLLPDSKSDGTETKYKGTTGKDTDGTTHYAITGNQNPKGNGGTKNISEDYAPDMGVCIKINVAEAGEVAVSMVINGDKTAYVYSYPKGEVSGGTKVLEDTPSSKAYYTYKFAAVPENDYYAYCAGSKAGFGSVTFTKGADAINNATINATNNGAIYNLAGQQVSSSYKGIVIRNGKKVLVK